MAHNLKHNPSRGDLVQIDWVDIYEDPTGDPEKATLKKRTSYAIFWDRRADTNGIEVVVTTTTIDDDATTQQGYCIYPAACILNLKVIKRARRVKQRAR
jgi:hypothetical protein